MMIELPRRKFLTDLGALIAAPAIVRASSIMPVRSFEEEWPFVEFSGFYSFVPVAESKLRTIYWISKPGRVVFSQASDPDTWKSTESWSFPEIEATAQ